MEWTYQIRVATRQLKRLFIKLYDARAPWIFFLVLVCIGVELNLVQAAQLNSTGRSIELHTTLRHGDSIVGSVLLGVAVDDKLSLKASGIQKLLVPLISAKVLRKIVSRAKNDRLNLEDFDVSGVSLHFDLSAFELIINIPNALQRDKMLSLNRHSDNRKYRHPASVSGYLNLRLGISSQSEKSSEDSNQVVSQNHSIDAAIRALGTVLEAEARFDKESKQSSGKLYRQGSRFVYDIPQSATRIVAGDIFTFGSYFQDSADLLGLGISRDFDLIPTRNVRPSAGRRFRLQRPSDVDVFVDGILVRKLNLPAGVFDLQDIPLTSGSNNIELLIEDASGQIERISFSIATAQDLLDNGEFDYSLAAGILSNPGRKGPQYDSSRSIATTTARYGVTPWLTLGVSAQGTKGVQQFGANALIATAIGRFNLTMATSKIDKRGTGQAVSFGYNANFGRDNPSAKSLVFQTEVFSPQFGGLNAAPTDTFSEVDFNRALNNNVGMVNASYSQRITSQLRGSIGIGYNRYREPFDDLYTLRTAVSGGISNTEASWNLSISMQNSHSEGSDAAAFFSLNWPLGKSSRLRFNTTAPDFSQKVTYTHNRDAGRTGGIRTNLSVESNSNNDAELSGGVEYTGNRFIATLDHDTILTQLSGKNRRHVTRARLESAIALADGKIAIGRPVSNSFAIVNAHSSLKNNKLRVDQTQNSDLVSSDGFGNLLIPDLGTYRGRLINYDVEDLPLGYDLGEGAFALKPPYQAGYSLQVGSDATVTMIGALIDQASSKPLGLVAGEAIYQNDPDIPPIIFFSNRKGRFAISGMRPGDYQLKLATQPERNLRVVVEKGANALLRMGDIKVK
jgi:outer membrane usher protein FimD/PapC